ncbi:MAG: response regulator transcription factor [Dehalococcoidia bacterium]|nr:response regulator transcription factor [Dehalococcoidia bacterium]
MKHTVFVVEDDAALRELYTYSLENEYALHCFDDGETLFEVLAKNIPDLILLDIMLPGDDGFAILARLKAGRATSHIPVIIVSAKGEEITKVKGLNMGADDYIAKPFGVLELAARIKANLRKNSKTAAEKIVYKDVVIDLSRHQITVAGDQIQTTLKEYDLLCLLSRGAEKVHEREAIFSEVWGGGFMGETRTLDMHIKELRKKLFEAKSEVVIKTIRGVGYVLT